MQSTGHLESHDTPPLTPTTFRHGQEGCGERVVSPHPDCQARVEPYLAAERLRTRFVNIIICLPCRTAWREAS